MRARFALVVALAALAACTQREDRGGFGNPPPSAPSPVPVETPLDRDPTRVARVSAPGGFRFEPEALRIQAGGTTEFVLSNQDGQEHTFVISELAVVMLAGAGQTVSSTVSIDPANAGRFAFFCSIGGHRAAGMEGTIVVGGE